MDYVIFSVAVFFYVLAFLIAQHRSIENASDEALYAEFAKRTALMEKVTMDAKLVEPQPGVALNLKDCIVIGAKVGAPTVSIYYGEGSRSFGGSFNAKEMWLTDGGLRSFRWEGGKAQFTDE